MRNRVYSKRTVALLVRAHEKLCNMTRAELAFEQRLVEAGIKYRAQWLMEPWIVDFYLPAHKLVVEIDGSSHDGQQLHDARRTAGLRRRRDVSGVARVPNEAVHSICLADVLQGKYDHKVADLLYPVRKQALTAKSSGPAVYLRRDGNTSPVK